MTDDQISKPVRQPHIGLAGVDSSENKHAIKWGKRFEWPMIFVALFIIVEWYLSERGSLAKSELRLIDWCIWLFFVIETVFLTSLVDNKTRYLRQNWVNLLIIALGIPTLFGYAFSATLRSLRLFIVISWAIHISSTVKDILARNHLGLTMLIGMTFAIFAGILVAGIDPGFETVWDGIWWAWVTVSTVGYGDLVPTTTAGRVFGAILIALGVGLFSLLTASFSAFFISQSEEELSKQEKMILEKLDRIERKLEAMDRNNNDT